MRHILLTSQTQYTGTRYAQFVSVTDGNVLRDRRTNPYERGYAGTPLYSDII